MTFRKNTITSCALSALLAATAWAALPGGTASAGSDTYLGEIMAFGGNFCPRGYADASGQLLPINQYQALFSLYGTNFGGDGRTSFGLPDLRGRSAVGEGQGAGLLDVRLGQKGGLETFNITLNQMPRHNHNIGDHRHDIAPHSHDAQLYASSAGLDSNSPAGAVLSAFPPVRAAYTAGAPSGATMSAGAVTTSADGPPRTYADGAGMSGTTGGGLPSNARSPYLTVRYCVALVGIFPSRN